MPSITAADLTRMRGNLFFDGPDRRAKLSRYWILLALASVIASAGVVGDSTATVIGAMIVAPLMTPILGTVLAIATGDRANLLRSVALVVAGATLAVGIGYLLGLVDRVAVLAETSSQVAGRINPRLIDLIAAFATGAVGAFAQCREDVSDTLPGVAIAISLVPPLTVVGLTLEAGATGEARGALLLFLTNVGAILLTGSIVMAIFGVPRHTFEATGRPVNHRNATAMIVALVLLLAVPLARASFTLTTDTLRRADVNRVARGWAQDRRWTVVSVNEVDGRLNVVATGPRPAPEPASLRRDLDDAGLAEVDVTVRLIPEERVELDGD